MTDIVQRLRDDNWRGAAQHLRDWSGLDALHDAAADAIEARDAEIAKLREALAEVLRRNAMMRDHLNGRLDGEAAHHFFGTIDTTQRIAREALRHD